MSKNIFAPWLAESMYDKIYFACLCILVIAMPTSHYVMSLIQLILGIFWLITEKHKARFLRFLQNKAVLVFVSIYMVHVVGMLWSQELVYGFTKDLKDKLPMLTLTFIVASSRPVTLKQAYMLLSLFSASVIVTTWIGFGVFLSGNYDTVRQLSPFISHVYFSMMVLLTVFILPWMTTRLTINRRLHMLAYLASVWLLFYLFVLSSLTGIVCLAGVVLFLLVRYSLYGQRTWLRVMSAFLVVMIILVTTTASVVLLKMVSEEIPVDEASLQETTLHGSEYVHYFDNNMRENGHYVFYFIADEELREAWNMSSDYDFEGMDESGNELKATIYRYMASLGLRKDRQGFMKLEPEDIRAIEQGVPNHLYNAWPALAVRIHQTFWEMYWYRQTGNPTGQTFSQRLELWRASLEAVKKKPVFGWGTGDIYIAVEYGLDKMNSQLENRFFKPHNQYLLFLLTLGIFGSFVMYGAYLLYVSMTGAYRHFPFRIFAVIMLVSMIGNNPIDAQAGQTFFTFFSLYFGLIYKPDGHDLHMSK